MKISIPLLALLISWTPLHAEDQLITNGTFENELQGWTLQTMGTAKATANAVSIDGDKHAAAVEVTEPGEKRYFVQLVQPNVHLEEGKTYLFTFRAKAKTPADIVVTVSSKEGTAFREMWRQENLALTEEWKEFRFSVPAKDPSDNVYLILSGMAKQPDEYFFTDVSLTEKN
ncbi:hypothetical protein BH09VER1_BH09VER1_13730 [soil metagenome]